MCEKIGNGFKWEVEYFGFQIYLSENRLLTMGKTKAQFLYLNIQRHCGSSLFWRYLVASWLQTMQKTRME